MSISDEYRDLYSQHYSNDPMPAWRRIGALAKARNICAIYSRGNLPPNPRVIEIGCGEGSVAQVLAEMHFFSDYRGFDLSETAIALAINKGVPGARFEAIRGSDIPLDDDCADVVVMSHVVEHLEHPRLLVGEARRLAQNLIVEVPTELNQGLPDDYDWNPVGHINKYDWRTIRQLIQTCQFDVIDQFTTHPSQSASLFGRAGLKGRIKWAAKDATLRATPSLARRLFTYHETLLATRSQRGHATAGNPGG